MEPNDFGKLYNPDLHIPLQEFRTKVTEFLVKQLSMERDTVESLLDAFITEEETIAHYKEGTFANPMSLVGLADHLQLPMDAFTSLFPTQFEAMNTLLFQNLQQRKTSHDK